LLNKLNIMNSVMRIYHTYLTTREHSVEYFPEYSRSSYAYNGNAFTLLYKELNYYKQAEAINEKRERRKSIRRSISTKKTGGKWILE